MARGAEVGPGSGGVTVTHRMIGREDAGVLTAGVAGAAVGRTAARELIEKIVDFHAKLLTNILNNMVNQTI